MSGEFDVIIVGAGTNGLVAANVLSKAGRRVVILERGEATGTLARPIEIAPGFRVPVSDHAGMMPAWIAADLELSVPTVDPSNGVSVATAEGMISLSTRPESAAQAIRPYSARDAARWPTFVQSLSDLSGFLGGLYQEPAPDVEASSLSDFSSLFKLGRKFRGLGQKRMTELLRVLPMSVQDWLDDQFESPLLKAAVGVGGVRDLRQGPRSGGTTFNLLHHLVGAPAGSVRARAYWREGPDALIKALESSATAAGATIRTRAEVKEIAVRDDAAAGVVLVNGESISGKIVVSTVDPVRTLLGLVDPVWLDPDLIHAARNVKLRGCTAFALFALDRLPAPNAQSSIFDSVRFGTTVSLTPSLDALERSYDATKYGEIADPLHVEIVAPSVTWPSLTPAGKHVLVARAHYAPYKLRIGEWTKDTRASVAGQIRRQIESAFPGFESSIVAELLLTPPDLEQRFGLTEGAVTQGELTLDQILFMRPIPGLGRYTTPIRGLYLGGAGCHPGPGISGGAGWLAAKRILSDA